MIRWLYELLYGSAPAEFRSSFGLQQSIERLRAATRRSVFSVLSAQAAVGPVTESKVRLQRVIPLVGNSFKPFFFGHFETRGSDTYLTGKFTTLLLVKVFMTIWLGFAFAFGIVFLIASRNQNTPWAASFAGLGMCALGIAFVWLGKWFARNDVAWLSSLISHALGAAPAGISSEIGIEAGGMPMPGSGPPTVLRVVAGVLALLGTMGLVMAALGVQSVEWGGRGSATTYFAGGPPRLMAALNGILLLVLALGVYQRKLWAWWFGLLYIGASWCLLLTQMFRDETFPTPTVVKVVFSALSLVVTAYWARWWYAQRAHFHSDNEGVNG